MSKEQVIKQYTGKVDDKPTYRTIGYVGEDSEGRPQVRLVIEGVEKAIADRRQYEAENNKEASKYVYLNLFENDRQQGASNEGKSFAERQQSSSQPRQR